MDHLEFLVAAYTAVWLILAFYIFILIRRNQHLVRKMDELEARLKTQEARADNS